MLPLWPVVGEGGGRGEVRQFCLRLDKEKREVTALVWGHKKGTARMLRTLLETEVYEMKYSNAWE